MWRQLRPFLGIVACLGMLSVIQRPALKDLTTESDLSAQAQAQADSLDREQLRLFKQFPDFGFRNVLADWVFLQFLQYFAEGDQTQPSRYAVSPDFFEVILQKDPYFRDFYLFLSSSSTLYAAMPERTVELMAIGLTQLGPQQPSDSFYVWRYKGIDELLFLGDSAAAYESYSTSADWASQSGHPNGDKMAELSAQMARFIEANPASPIVQISAWSNILANAIDEPTQRRAITEIRQLGGKVTIGEDGGVKLEYPKEN